MPGDFDKALQMEEDRSEGEVSVFGVSMHDLLIPALVSIIIALLVSLATVLVVKGGQDDTIEQSSAAASRQGAAAAVKAIQKTQVVACGRTQVTRGLDRFQIVSASSLAPDLKRLRDLTVGYDQILDCQKTYVSKDGAAELLPERLQECFVALVGSGYFIKRKPETGTAALSTICAAKKLP